MWLENLLVAVLGGLGVTALFALLEGTRSMLVARRRVSPGGIAVRLRGVPLTYPGFWRPGYLDQSTARWRPRSHWGVPAALGGATISSVAPAERDDALPVFAQSDLVVTCMDHRGRVFQLAAVAADIERVRRCLRNAAAARPAAPGPVRLRRTRQYVPLSVVILLPAAVLWLAYWVLPVLGDRVVDGVVVANRGPEYLCAVGWTDPVDGTSRDGYAPCAGEAPGDPVPVHLMGWPRTGVSDEPETSVAGGVIGASVGVVFAGIFLYSGIIQRRRLTDPGTGEPPGRPRRRRPR